MTKKLFATLGLLGVLSAPMLVGCNGQVQADSGPTTAATPPSSSRPEKVKPMTDKVVKTDAEWKAAMTPDEYQVMRQKGTERAFTGKYWNVHDKGVYRCAACGNPLFSADTKF